MPKRFYVETDGGPTWVGTYTSYQPYTYKVVDAETPDSIQVATHLKGVALAARLNVGDISWEEAQELYN